MVGFIEQVKNEFGLQSSIGSLVADGLYSPALWLPFRYWK
jgi:hypothetical protein